MTSCFLDTGYLIALEASDDQHHDAAVRHWRDEVLASPPLIVTTSYVFDEVVTFSTVATVTRKLSRSGSVCKRAVR